MGWELGVCDVEIEDEELKCRRKCGESMGNEVELLCRSAAEDVPPQWPNHPDKAGQQR